MQSLAIFDLVAGQRRGIDEEDIVRSLQIRAADCKREGRAGSGVDRVYGGDGGRVRRGRAVVVVIVIAAVDFVLTPHRVDSSCNLVC